MKILGIVFIVGGAALAFCVTSPYPVLGAGTLLLGVAVVFLFGASILTTAPDVKNVSAECVFVAILPWVLAGVLVANGALDRSPEVIHQMVVAKGAFNPFYGRAWIYLTVQSWRPGHSTETLFVKTGFSFRTKRYFPGVFFNEGESIAVGVRSGAFGMPWTSRILQGHTAIEYPAGPQP